MHSARHRYDLLTEIDPYHITAGALECGEIHAFQASQRRVRHFRRRRSRRVLRQWHFPPRQFEGCAKGFLVVCRLRAQWFSTPRCFAVLFLRESLLLDSPCFATIRVFPANNHSLLRVREFQEPLLLSRFVVFTSKNLSRILVSLKCLCCPFTANTITHSSVVFARSKSLSFFRDSCVHRERTQSLTPPRCSRVPGAAALARRADARELPTRPAVPRERRLAAPRLGRRAARPDAVGARGRHVRAVPGGRDEIIFSPAT